MIKEIIIEDIKNNKAAIAKRALIVLGVVAGLALVKVLCTEKEEVLDEDGNVIDVSYEDDKSDESET